MIGLGAIMNLCGEKWFLRQRDLASYFGRQALIRLAVAQASWLCAGLGFFWQLWDRQARTWHDIASGTQLVTLPKGTFKD